MTQPRPSTLFTHAIAPLLAWAICTTTPAASTAAPHEKAVLSVAISVGITPESLVANGVVEQDVNIAAQILANLEQASDLRSQLGMHLEEAATLSQQLSEVTAALKVQSGDADLLLEFDVLQQDLGQTNQQVEIVRDELVDEALDGIAGEVKEDLASWRKTVGRRVPPAFRVLDLTDEQWSGIEVALRAQARAERQGGPFTGDLADLLNDIQANVDVITAEQRLELQLAPVKAIFAQYAD